MQVEPELAREAFRSLNTPILNKVFNRVFQFYESEIKITLRQRVYILYLSEGVGAGKMLAVV